LLKYEKDFALDDVYYPTSTVFLSLAILSLLRVTQLSETEKLPSGELGKLIGIDRIPEVKTLRKRIASFCNQTDVTQWSQSLSKDWMGDNPDLSAVLYIDGHIKLYYGKTTNIPKRFVSRMRLCLSGTTDYWVNDMLGQPFFVINKTISEGLIAAINDDLLEKFNNDVPNQPNKQELESNKYIGRYMLVFDREGYSPDFFYDLWQKRISICTYKKNVTDKWDDNEFILTTGSHPMGEKQEMYLAERGVLLQNKTSHKKIWAREIRKKSKSGHQTSIITTNYTLSTIMIGLYMFARWSQENFFKYMMANFGIDTLTSYLKENIDEMAVLVNPHYRALEAQRRKITSQLSDRKTKFASVVLQEAEEGEVKKYLIKKDELKTEIEDLQKRLIEIIEERNATPRKIKYVELPENEKFKSVVNQRKHFLDTIKLIAYRAETAISNMIKIWMFRQDCSRSFLMQVYKTDANIEVDKESKRLYVIIHTLSHHKDDKILQKLCNALNETETVFPDTNYTIFYKMVSS